MAAKIKVSASSAIMVLYAVAVFIASAMPAINVPAPIPKLVTARI